MSGQSLVKLLVIVWLTATLVAVFIGLPAFLTAAGIEINATLIVSALAALGSFSASGVALWIATSDRRKRQRERDAEDEAQAKLVVVWGLRLAGGGGPSAQLQVIVRNLGPRSIVDATFVDLFIEGHEHLHPSPTSDPVLPVVTAGGDGNFMFKPATDGADPYYRAVIGKWEGKPGGGSDLLVPPTIQDSTKMTATVRWTDASGKTWERRGLRGADLMKMAKPVRVVGD